MGVCLRIIPVLNNVQQKQVDFGKDSAAHAFFDNLPSEEYGTSIIGHPEFGNDTIDVDPYTLQPLRWVKPSTIESRLSTINGFAYGELSSLSKRRLRKLADMDPATKLVVYFW